MEKALKECPELAQSATRRATLGDVIDFHLRAHEARAGKTKRQCLDALRQGSVATVRCSDIRSYHLTELMKRLSETKIPRR